MSLCDVHPVAWHKGTKHSGLPVNWVHRMMTRPWAGCHAPVFSLVAMGLPATQPRDLAKRAPTQNVSSLGDVGPEVLLLPEAPAAEGMPGIDSVCLIWKGKKSWGKQQKLQNSLSKQRNSFQNLSEGFFTQSKFCHTAEEFEHDKQRTPRELLSTHFWRLIHTGSDAASEATRDARPVATTVLCTLHTTKWCAMQHHAQI